MDSATSPAGWVPWEQSPQPPSQAYLHPQSHLSLIIHTSSSSTHFFLSCQQIVAMTCTHAALKRREFIELAFKYDNLIMEEAAQILEIETFIPMLLQVRVEGKGGASS